MTHSIFICFCFSVLTAVVIVNKSVEKKNSTKLTGELKNAGLTSVEETLCQRYLTKLISAKQEKAQVGYMTVFLLKGVVFLSNITSVILIFIATIILTAQETIDDLFSDLRDNVVLILEVLTGFALNQTESIMVFAFKLKQYSFSEMWCRER